MRGWESESGDTIPPRMRTRMIGVLKFAALSNRAPVECISTHALSAGGEGGVLCFTMCMDY